MKHCIMICIAGMLCLFTPCPRAYADAPVHTLQGFIMTAMNDRNVAGYRQIASRSADAPRDTPYFRKLELRAEIDDLDDTKQTYRLRLSPRAWGETDARRRLVETLGQVDALDYAACLDDALKIRYQLALEYVEVSAMIVSNKALETVYTDRVRVLRRKAGTGALDLSAIVDAEDDLSALRLELMTLESRKAELSDTVNTLAGSTASIDFTREGLIGIERIDAMVRELNPAQAATNSHLERRKIDVTLAQCRLAVEHARSRDYLSFIQIGRTVEEESRDNRTSLEIGIRLPFVNSHREAVWSRTTALKREELSCIQANNEAIAQAAWLKRDIAALAARYGILTERERKGDAVNALKNPMVLKGRDPVELLKLKESILKNDIQLIRTSAMIRRYYIELMGVTGRLSSLPRINYLSPDLRELS